MKFLLILIFTMTSFSSQAGVLLEPWLGSIVLTKTEIGNPGEDPESMSGLGYGFKLGYQGRELNWGIDWTTIKPQIESDFFEEYGITTQGLFIGYRPGRFRMTFTYILSGALVAVGTNSEITPGLKFDGLVGSVNGFKLSFGYHLLPKVAINLDLMRHNYTDISTSFIGVSGDTDQDDITGENITLLSVSFPFTFFN